MKKELAGRDDVTVLVNTFYEKVKTDDIIGHIFRDIEHFNWDVHIPIMISFWSSILFLEGSYRGNPVRTHVELNRNHPLGDAHFQRWKELFFQTLDELFEGPKVAEAKKKVEAMEQLMKFKIGQSMNPNFIQ